MSTFLLVAYRIKPGNKRAVEAWFTSDEGQDILRRVQSETHVAYVCTYLTTGKDAAALPAADYDAYDLWEAPDLAAFERLPESPAYAEFETQFHPLIIDQSWKVATLERANA